MKTSSSLFLSTIVVAVAGLASAAASAQEATPWPELSSFVSQKPCAEVRTESLQAVADHRMAHNDEVNQRPAIARFIAAKSRAQVAAETLETVRLGLIRHNDVDAPFATPTAEQQRLIEQAGERARGTQITSR